MITDCYVQCSLYEGQSNSLLEAIASSCFVVSSDIPPQREVLTDGDLRLCGVLLPLNESNWCQVFEQMSRKEIEIAYFKRLALSRSKDFSVKSMADGFMGLIGK
jgi:glycosyltransferase involved in cell wall biosynthesis